MMSIQGYMVKVDWDGERLVAEGTKKAGQIALRGPEWEDGPVVLAREDIASVKLKKANPMVNGNLIIHTVEGRKYQLHFRRKQGADFAALAEALPA